MKVKVSNEYLEELWQSIPIGKENRVNYYDLIGMWGYSKRMTRAYLHALSLYDNGDDYILIRSCKGGFWRSDDKEEIVEYKNECLNKGRSIMAPVKKINRVMKFPNDCYNLFDLSNND